MHDENKIRWIHLSDLHMEKRNLFDRKLTFDALWQDLNKFMDDGFTFDFIIFSGDIAYHALKSEYDLAITEFFEPLLSVTNVSRERLFIVPGNHDVYWKLSKQLKSPIDSIKSLSDLRNLLMDIEMRNILFSPLDNYRNFIRDLIGLEQEFKDPAFCYTREIITNNFLLGITGLNSSWLSGFNHDSDGNVNDLGNLAITDYQVVQSKSSNPCDYRFYILHHPFAWLMDIDRYAVEDRLIRQATFILRGHLHKSNVISQSSLEGQAIIIPAGAIFDKNRSPLSFNIVELECISGTGTVFFRRFSQRRQEWQKDIESTGELKDGKVEFKVPNFTQRLTQTCSTPLIRDIKKYTLKFTDECLENLSRLSLTQDDIINLVQGEFRSHINYFFYDLENYPLPLKTNHIVYLNKISTTVEFYHVISCSKDQAKLASWNDILALYRRATRMAYRKNTDLILTSKGTVGRSKALFDEIRQRLLKHFKRYEGIKIELLLNKISEGQDNEDTRKNEITYHLFESLNADNEVKEIMKSIDYGDIESGEGVGLIIANLERSLQHIHKIIIRYPPI